ncbi:hypothetical protein AA0119_g11868 [Alternaria tenuissima]|uniref:BTB domain-containing protein n=1 Tax=Alternaria tenuissima TaxID=119927 RepID=A0A4Q4P0M2_9PLEO|nr:hypothetical protein AA0115_g1295 [Alternaria tenuissima]RYN88411.1 hypothetical protein AA0119_g11868 [Alternaria tenuissima]RYO21496.1 hypothetical protein AA0121_g3261 [Alternaria tenuissima]RYO53386.1 hypothetical protein AA0116_g10266 [Alternaria tenuissima]
MEQTRTKHGREHWMRLLASGDYSDFTITCGSDTYRVHKAIVCKRSGFFERAERFPRPVGEEASEGKVDLTQDEPEIVRLLVEYLYENDYEAESDEKRKQKQAAKDLRSQLNSDRNRYELYFPHNLGYYHSPNSVCPHHRCVTSSPQNCVDFTCKICAPILEAGKTDPKLLLVHSKMYAIGDKYDVAGLKELACKKFSPIGMSLWNNEAFVQAAEHVLNSTPDSDVGLREVLCQTIVSHIELLNKPAVADLLDKHTKFMFKVLRRVSELKAGLKPSA